MASPALFLEQQSAARTNKREAHKQAYSDEEHETMLSGLNNSITNLQQRIAQVGPGHPDYSGLQRQLNQAVTDRTALFHPNQPGGLERLGKLLWTKAHGPDTPDADAPRIAQVPVAGTQGTTLPGMGTGTNFTTPTLPATSVPVDTRPNTPTNTPTPAELKARYPQDIAAGAQHVNQFDQMHQALIEGGFSQEDADKALRITAGLAPKPISYRPTTPHWQPYKMADGSVEELNLNDPNVEIPDGATPIPLGSTVPHQSMASLEQDIRAWFPNGATPEQREWVEKRRAAYLHPETVSSREAPGYDAQGNPIKFTLSSTSRKDFGANGPPPSSTSIRSPQVSNGSTGAQPAAAAGAGAAATGTTTLTGQPVTVGQPTSTAAVPPPKTAGEARKRAATVKGTAAAPATPGAPAAPTGFAALHKNTPAQTKADKDYNDSISLATLADQAEKNPTAANQKSLALAIIRTTAGRVNMQEFNVLTSKQGLGNSIEQLLNNLETGKLAPEVFKGLVGVARDWRKSKLAAYNEAYRGTNVKPKTDDATTGGASDIDSIIKGLKQPQGK